MDWRGRLPENLAGRFVTAMEWCMINFGAVLDNQEYSKVIKIFL